MAADQPRSPSSEELRRAKQRARERLSTMAGFGGVGVCDGTVRVYVRDAEAAGNLPVDIDGVPVEAVVVGEIRAE
jgi:hypothetical protein